MANSTLNAAKAAKNDEFYTQLSDIENELRHYKEHFRGKTVLCNCDDPRISNFFKYFALNFEHLGLKRLITTCYKNQNVDLFSKHDSEQAVYLIYDGDKNETPVDAQKLKVGTKYIMRFIDGSTNKPVASVQKTATKFWTLTYEFANKNLVTAEAQDDNNKMNQIFTAKTAGSTTVSAGFIDKEDTYFQGNGYKASISIKVIN